MFQKGFFSFLPAYSKKLFIVKKRWHKLNYITDKSRYEVCYRNIRTETEQLQNSYSWFFTIAFGWFGKFCFHPENLLLRSSISKYLKLLLIRFMYKKISLIFIKEIGYTRQFTWIRYWIPFLGQFVGMMNFLSRIKLLMMNSLQHWQKTRGAIVGEVKATRTRIHIHQKVWTTCKWRRGEII